ncbi:hypothetical protein ACQUQU_16845 [Thalassolituus sp. LLYu03]|uniref:hypothetical protein n=1 Tax=Thalassolituus sp. LLYu03 TaxID=3421656 RepID=UPI003D2D7C05
MSHDVTIPSGLLYLPLSEEVIPLLKRAVIPLTAPEYAALPGYQRPPVTVAAVSGEEYEAHLRAEFARLPPALRDLMTVDTFIQQAERKRRDIEQALLVRKQQAAAAPVGNPEDWLWQTFSTDPDCALSWSLHGFNRVWLGIQPDFCPQADIRPLRYDEQWPADFPSRLWADAPARSPLRQHRLVLARKEAGPPITVAGSRQWLLRLPPKALRIVLVGSAVPAPALKRLQAFLRQDFRYQRIPVGYMAPDGRGMSWHFHKRPLTRCENP